MNTNTPHQDDSEDATTDTTSEAVEKLQPHVQQFVNILREHDDAVRAKDKERQAAVAQKLTEFYGTLGEGKHDDLRQFVQQQTVGRTIDDDRGKVHSGITRTLHWAPRLVGVAADVLSQFTYQTLRLAVSVVGLGGVGVLHGMRTTWRAFKRVFSQAA